METHEAVTEAGSKRDGSRPAWVAGLRRFEVPSGRKAAWQLANTVVPYLALMVSTLWAASRGAPLWLILVLAVPTAGFMVRTFVLFHDCVHGSFVGNPRHCRLIGRLLGVLVLTPYTNWRHFHLGHHATAGNLDRRDIGDIWTLTAEEYRGASWWLRTKYRVFRSPLVLFGIGPIALFLVVHRLPGSHPTKSRVISVVATNLAVLAMATLASLAFGLANYLLVQFLVLLLGATCGVFLFYVQHQFSPSYWSRDPGWNSYRAALEGSSWFKLPKLLQWFSANIGLHHVHHLRPKIPNYNLQPCLDATPELRSVARVTFRRSLESLRFNLWDERAQSFVSFRAAARAQRSRPSFPSGERSESRG